ncbi:MAG: CinA family protein [Agathobacter sp.]|nr:CinA family protein [Agathobacter sp.]MBQ3559081.1 CinA family protein [Agathobacter sp.]
MTENRLLELLSKHNLKIATAESCTGGLVAGVLCDISGISAHFEEGYITYSEEAKCKNLGVLPETIAHFGVVSCEVAEEMAMGAAERANADCAVATTGVAGPTGGTEENPVGTVCFACVVRNQVLTERMIFEGNRMEIRMQAAVYAIEMLCDYIESCYDDGDDEEL